MYDLLNGEGTTTIFFFLICKYLEYTALRHNLAHLGHKKLAVYCFEYNFMNFFFFRYVLAQGQVIRVFYRHKINIINILQWFLMSDNIFST